MKNYPDREGAEQYNFKFLSCREDCLFLWNLDAHSAHVSNLTS